MNRLPVDRLSASRSRLAAHVGSEGGHQVPHYRSVLGQLTLEIFVGEVAQDSLREGVSSVYRGSMETLENLELGLDNLSKPVSETASEEADAEAVDAG